MRRTASGKEGSRLACPHTSTASTTTIEVLKVLPSCLHRSSKLPKATEQNSADSGKELNTIPHNFERPTTYRSEYAPKLALLHVRAPVLAPFRSCGQGGPDCPQPHECTSTRFQSKMLLRPPAIAQRICANFDRL
jgi:hypothetical protein